MDTYTPALESHFTLLLAKREAELRAVLGAGICESQAAQSGHEVQDFKDIAVEETQAVVDEAKAEQAAAELEQIVAARLRLRDGTYGECQDCGDGIDARRLDALPGTPLCAACQQVHESRLERSLNAHAPRSGASALRYR